jgi:membrane protein implicated in regulation of membrane protease activity
MNKGMLIVAIPAAAVLAGYLVMIHGRGLSPNYPLLAMWLAGGVLAIWLVRRGLRKKKESSGN